MEIEHAPFSSFSEKFSNFAFSSFSEKFPQFAFSSFSEEFPYFAFSSIFIQICQFVGTRFGSSLDIMIFLALLRFLS